MAALELGGKAIEFSLPATDGKTYSLDQFTEYAVLGVIFSCNHCPYVQAWEERMVKIQSDYEARGVQLITINANDAEKYPSDNFEAMKLRAQERGFNFPYLHDESQATASAYGAERTPEVYLFDADRRLRYHGAIDDNYDDPGAVEFAYLREAIDALLTGDEPGTPYTQPVGCTIKWKQTIKE